MAKFRPTIKIRPPVSARESCFRVVTKPHFCPLRAPAAFSVRANQNPPPAGGKQSLPGRGIATFSRRAPPELPPQAADAGCSLIIAGVTMTSWLGWLGAGDHASHLAFTTGQAQRALTYRPSIGAWGIRAQTPLALPSGSID
ncbi:hypothetical protein MAPG_00924 [Magnaporthiopsis poae ATCC 64411]|uniref:Uncharacterized protein n=1 Tax=Magnaporthiopsis poae (strain ATCC 64411 / 73-15) TaxID=644358 RepID=A0A0C4DMB9_MAGP6|nr:hypothetical protein MAPG_00924 [Magnaporthiopsis poae ATCC 64411]